MKIKGPKNQADFIEVLRMKITHGFIGPRNAQIFSLNNAQILIWPPDYMYIEQCFWHTDMLGNLSTARIHN